MLDVILNYNGTWPSLDNNLVVKYRIKCKRQYNTLGTFLQQHKKPQIIALNIEY